jgi:hypothetical protein
MKQLKLLALFSLFILLSGVVLFTNPSAIFAASKKAKCLLTDKKCDFDKDGLNNGIEKKFKTNPKKKDTDKDGILDGDEDKDEDGIPNEDEDDARCKDKDYDNDGISDEDENDFKTKLKSSDSDGNGIVDGNEDSDGNGISNEDEDDSRVLCSKEDEDDDSTVSGDPTPTPISPSTPTPGGTNPGNPTPTPMATSTPTSPPLSGNNCNANRETVGFGIPSGLTGRGNTGKNLFILNCQGCHPGFSGKSYSSIYNSRNVGAMAGVKNLLSNTQNSADITAHLNCK